MMRIGQSETWQLKIPKMLIALLPLLTMIGLKFGEKLYLDREYIKGTVSTSYTWHGIFMSLSPSSYFREKYGADGSDASAFLLGEKYYRENEPDKLEETYWLDKAGGQINRLNWRLHEEGCRQMVQKIILENKFEFLRLTFATKAEIYVRFLLQNTWLTIVPLVLVVGGVLKFSHIQLGDWASREALIIPLTLFFGSWFTPLIGKALSHAVADGLLIFWILSAQGIFQALIFAKRIRAF